jgi:hypothetical protein
VASSRRYEGLKPYEYWILWVLDDEGGVADLDPTIYQGVYARLKSEMTPERDDAPVETSQGEPKWKNEIRFALRNMSADNNSGDGWVTHVRRGCWGITDSGREWLKNNPAPPKWRTTRHEIV